MVANTFSPYLAPEPGMATSNATASLTIPGSIMIIGVIASQWECGLSRLVLLAGLPEESLLVSHNDPLIHSLGIG
jgi:hypothetical protein